jgi:hypothetical protein
MGVRRESGCVSQFSSGPVTSRSDTYQILLYGGKICRSPRRRFFGEFFCHCREKCKEKKIHARRHGPEVITRDPKTWNVCHIIIHICHIIHIERVTPKEPKRHTDMIYGATYPYHGMIRSDPRAACGSGGGVQVDPPESSTGLSD